MSPGAGLAAINFFMADVHGGLGPFLATWLATAAHWNPAQIGLVITVGGIATLVLYGPAGALVDRIGRPLLLLSISVVAVVVGTLALVPARGFVAVLGAQIAAALGGALVAPALTLLTLSVVGKKAFPRQQGRNEAFNHAGNLMAAGLVGGVAIWVGPAAAFYVLAAMALATGAAIALFPRDAIDEERGRGRKRGERSEGLRSLVRNRKLLILGAALALFFLGNMAILPLLGEKLAASGRDATAWMAICVMIAQATMVPTAYLAGRISDKYALRWLLVVACAVVPIRGVMAAFAPSPVWLVPLQMLAGVGEGLVGVALPALVADFTWGSGRTQTAIGAVSTLQGVGAAVSNTVGGLLAHWMGWTVAFLGLAAPSLLGVGLALLLVPQASAAEETGSATVGDAATENAAAISARV